MRQSLRTVPAILFVLVIGVFAGCGGDDGGSGGDSAGPAVVEPTATVSVEQFKSGFADETGFELTSEPFPGDSQTLSFDDDGDLMTISEAETDFIDEFGIPQIYLVDPDGDTDMIFDLVVGEPGGGEPTEFGGDMARLDRKVFEKPDADGVIWSKECVRFEKDESRNVCSWSGTKRYGANVIVKWPSTGKEIEPTAARLDQAMSATVADSGT